MTKWDKIYKNYLKGGRAWATLSEGVNSDFLEFVKRSKFPIHSALDIGCGTGKLLHYLKSLDFRVAGIDSSPTAVSMSKKILGKNTDLKVKNMFTYKFSPNTYDLVVSVSTLHHGRKEQVQTAVKNIQNSLVSGGKFFITLPDIKGTQKWDTFKEHKKIAEGTFVPLKGPEAGLPHSFYTKTEVKELFAKFNKVKVQKTGPDLWLITGSK